MNDHQSTNHHFRRVAPWTFDEFILVSGFECVYSHDKPRGVLLVHLPGRSTYTVDELRALGHTVIMPRRGCA